MTMPLKNPFDNTFNSHSHSNLFSAIYIPFSEYGGLIKGKQSFLLVYTTFFAYLISAWPTIEFVTLIILIIGLFLAVSGTTMINMYLDKDIDAIMERTQHRPIPAGKVNATAVLLHGLIFTIVGILICGMFVNTLTMIVVFLGFFFDVFIYTLWLKRRTRFSIIFGGIAGGLPAVAGRTAAINAVDPIALLFLLFVLSWIPLHILTLALLPKTKKGYLKAQVPMWPVVASEEQTIFVITLSALINAISILLTAILLNVNLIVLVIVILSTLTAIFLSISNFIHPSQKTTFRLFKFASIYMALSFFLLFVGILF